MFRATISPSLGVSRDLFKFWKIIDISEMRDMVAMEDYRKSCMAYQMARVPMTLVRLKVTYAV